MAPRKNAQGATPAKVAESTPTASAPTTSPSQTSSKAGSPADFQQIVQKVWDGYWEKTPQRTKLLDSFMGFLVVIGVVQFVYVVIGGNYPFNAFLSGFSAAVGQFVLTASLRIQTNTENEKHFQSISHERAFADFVFGSLILHFFCINFIN